MPMDYETARHIVEKHNGWGTSFDVALSLLLARASGVPADELDTGGLTSTNRGRVLSCIEVEISGSDKYALETGTDPL